MGKARESRSVTASVLRWLRRIGTVLAVLVGVGLFGVAMMIRHYERDLPSATELKRYSPPQVTRVLARDGSLLGEEFVERRTSVRLDSIPEVVRACFLAAEDSSFYEHEGLDYLGMLRAIWVNVRGTSKQGASTITQQVVKNVLLSPERTFDRKVREVLLARRIEQELTKDEIFELYLNQIYFGHGRYGVEEAARYYFGKGIAELELTEAAVLAAVPKGPSLYSPREHPDRALRRRTYVLDQMQKKGFIRPELAEEAKAAALVLAPLPESAPALAPEATSEALRVLKATVGEAASRGGYTVVTTIDPELQRAARAAVQRNVEELIARQHLVAPFKKPKKGAPKPFEGDPPLGRFAVFAGEVVGADDDAGEVAVRVGTLEGRIELKSATRHNPKGLLPSAFAEPGAVLRVRILEPGPEDETGRRTKARLKLELAPESALVAIDVGSREIVALVGAVDGTRGGLDRASRSKRQPGSTFKAFVFAEAIRSRKLTAASLLETSPSRVEGYQPRNADKSLEGEPMRMRPALAKSVNVAAVHAQAEVGAKSVVELARALGIKAPLEPTPSLGLGAYEVTPRELATAYAALAAGGLAEEPRLISRIIAPSGREVPLSRARQERVLSEAEAFVITELLREVVESGTGRAAKGVGRPVAGKTGTSNDRRDAWFAGYTPEVACVVWTGNDDASPLGVGETGARAALPAFTVFMKAAHAKRPAAPFAAPSGVRVVAIDPKTGKRAREGQEDAVEEIFLEGTEPEEVAEEPEDPETEAEIAVYETEGDGGAPVYMPDEP